MFVYIVSMYMYMYAQYTYNDVNLICGVPYKRDVHVHSLYTHTIVVVYGIFRMFTVLKCLLQTELFS